MTHDTHAQEQLPSDSFSLSRPLHVEKSICYFPQYSRDKSMTILQPCLWLPMAYGFLSSCSTHLDDGVYLLKPHQWLDILNASRKTGVVSAIGDASEMY